MYNCRVLKRESVTVRSPAKINLHLQITGRRKNGYHDLFSIMQMVSLYDTISICSLKTTGVIVQGNLDIPYEDNLITKAAKAFLEYANMDMGLSISFRKEIPHGAGLGGGSSNAASVLLGLNDLLADPLSLKDLNHLGLLLGADVPFFLHHAAAKVTGIGDIIVPLPPREDYWVVLVYPGFPISTPYAFSLFDDTSGSSESEPTKKTAKHADICANYRNKPLEQWSFFNSFSNVLDKHYHVLKYIKDMLRRGGAALSSVSGSGSVLFGIYENKVQAELATASLEREYDVWLVQPLGCLPDVI